VRSASKDTILLSPLQHNYNTIHVQNAEHIISGISATIALVLDVLTTMLWLAIILTTGIDIPIHIHNTIIMDTPVLVALDTYLHINNICVVDNDVTAVMAFRTHSIDTAAIDTAPGPGTCV
jgi:hypothetical protein